jgi:CelD/BcsL family acetyltransferase involved in cellulose biosynthesis
MITVRVVESEAGLVSLADEWERLQASSAVTSVFESFEWQSAWWRTYGQGRPLRLLVASDEGAVVGILPLWVHTVEAMRVPVRLLRFVGSGGDTYPDDLGAILAPSREAEVARALADAVMKLRGWDVLLLTDMQSESAFPSAMRAAAGAKGAACLTGCSERIAFLELPATWDAWLATLHRDRRYRIKNIRKKLVAAHKDARFFVWSDPETLDQGVDRLVHLHRKRWSRVEGGSKSFETPEYVGFHRAVMKALLPKDRLRLYALEAGGEVIAMYYFYRFRDRVYLMQSGFDPDLAAVKPGQVLLGHVVEHAIGEKDTVLDFLRGDHRYKDELATGERETVYVTAFRSTPGAWAYRTRRLYLPKLKAEAKRLYARAQARVRVSTPEDDEPSAEPKKEDG